nr:MULTISPECIES: hypothetical protein [unclassified Allomuricauda]
METLKVSMDTNPNIKHLWTAYRGIHPKGEWQESDISVLFN